MLYLPCRGAGGTLAPPLGSWVPLQCGLCRHRRYSEVCISLLSCHLERGSLFMKSHPVLPMIP